MMPHGQRQQKENELEIYELGRASNNNLKMKSPISKNLAILNGLKGFGMIYIIWG